MHAPHALRGLLVAAPLVIAASLTGCPGDTQGAGTSTVGGAPVAPGDAIDPRRIVVAVRGAGKIVDATTRKPVRDAEVVVKIDGVTIATHAVTDGRMNWETRFDQQLTLDPSADADKVVIAVNHPDYETFAFPIVRPSGEIVPVLGGVVLEPKKGE